MSAEQQQCFENKVAGRGEPATSPPTEPVIMKDDNNITSESRIPMSISGLTPQQERKIKSLEASIARLQSQISETEVLLSEAQEKYKSIYPKNSSPPDPGAIVKRHIHLLHEYNEIKDVAQGLLGLIAEGKGVRYVDVQKEYGIGGND